MRNYLLLLLVAVALLVAGGSLGSSAESTPPDSVDTAALTGSFRIDVPMPEPEILAAHLATLQAPEPEREPEAESGYEDAEQWCYEVDDVPPCRREDDKSANPDLPTECTPDPRTGRRRICVNAWWVAGSQRACVPKPLDRSERQDAREELKALVYRRVDGKHEGLCTPQAWWRWGQGQSVKAGYCHPERLEKHLRLVSWREVRHDNRKSHLLDPDKKAAWNAWRKKRELYVDVNPAYWQSYRWRGRGPYGQNVPTHLWRWDAAAPPEVFCNRVIATETYLVTMRDCHRKLRGLRGGNPDWWDLHHCASGGSYARPEVIPEDDGSYVQRARSKRIGLDPFEKVPFSWLGTPIDHNMPAVDAIEAEIASHLAQIQG